ncbi:DUF3794 and LysM peptidoglycan-binding domain-containing protein [Alloiococcus sp. CFN-8]|uniref:DUF3794 and LysM peptidoglycan-binding domain-containing protein n=1 Tax=Alloiococcus sp. CFN-8 TaxID=3416081 RepID=UPI003CE9173F
MPDVNFVNESIELEQLLSEINRETMVKGEYLIPDTHPDVVRILMIHAKPVIINAEVMQDKIYLEGQVEYNLLYFSKEEEKTVLNSVTYNDKFNSQIEAPGAEHRMLCEADCDVEHINVNIINERKISIDGIFNINCSLYKIDSLAMIKDIESSENIQMQKTNISIDKVMGAIKQEVIGKGNITIAQDKPEVYKIIKVFALLHKKDVRVMEGRIQCGAFCKVNIIYKGEQGGDIYLLEDDMYISEEIEMEKALPNMSVFCDYTLLGPEYSVREDENGERRIIDLEAPVIAMLKVVSNENLSVIKDAYSPNLNMELEKESFPLVSLLGQNTSEVIVKDNIYLEPQDPLPVQILGSIGRVALTDKKLLENKLILEGIIKADIIYKTNDENNSVNLISGDIPFTSTLEIPGLKIDMTTRVRVNLESIESDIEANTLALKAVININVRSYYKSNKDFLVSVKCSDEPISKKKSSITIYMVQPGDTLWEIAKKYYTTEEELLHLNEIDSESELLPGKMCLIPGRAII